MDKEATPPLPRPVSRRMGPAPSASVPAGLTRNARHVYAWNDGRSSVRTPIPSVTTVLKVIDKSGPLVGWAKRETAACAVRNLQMLSQMRDHGGDAAAVDWLKRIPDYQRDTAADVGSRVHVLAEQVARGLDPTVAADEAPFIDAYREFLGTFQPRFLAIEEMVCSIKYDYAGTLDAICELGGETWLLDIKTGSGLYAEAGLQMAAYAGADFIGRPGDTRRYRLPPVTRFGVVHLRPGIARLVEYGVNPATLDAFLQARALFAWNTGPAKHIVGAELPSPERVQAA